MRTIADILTRLRAHRQRPHGLGIPLDDQLKDLPAFGSNPGGLRARVYIPNHLQEPAPLVVVLHGCTQSAATYNYGSGWSSLADRHGFALLFPEQQRPNNPNLCFNWFLTDDNRRGSGEALSIRQMIDRIVSLHGLDQRRIFITGLSAGGAMAGTMLAAYPEVFAGGAIIAGIPYGSTQSISEAFDRMRGHGGPTEGELGALVRRASQHSGPWPSISVWHGSGDKTVVPSNARDIIDQWRDVHSLADEPTSREVIGRHTRRIWTDPSGRVVLEENIIAGMGHGTPLEVSHQGCGAAGPYMIDVGVSSTQLIASSWGLMAPAMTKKTTSESKLLPMPSIQVLKYHHDPSKGGERPASKGPRAAGIDGVQKVIEGALRAAGLMP